MTASGLLQLYPRAWRERYGGEFLDTVGGDRLTAQQVIDITMGAIDAWLSADVRRSTTPLSTSTATKQKGRTAMVNARVLCGGSRMRMRTRDGVISAAVLLSATVTLLAVGIWLNRSGFHETGEDVKSLETPLSLLISMPFGLLKGQPWRAQAFVIGGTTFCLIAIAVLATKI